MTSFTLSPDGSYSYYADGSRKSADVVTSGVTVHNGAYSYDGGGRLVQVVDSATNEIESYAWNADGTLASMPGSGYTREFACNEEAQLLSISHSGTVAYQYAYGAGARTSRTTCGPGTLAGWRVGLARRENTCASRTAAASVHSSEQTIPFSRYCIG